MISSSYRCRLFLLASIAAVAAVPCVAAETESKAFRAESLADGVYLLRPVETTSERTNSLLVLRDDGPLVVDSQPSPRAARELLAEIRELSPDPVRYLVLSHPHAEAAGGAAAFPDTTVIIGSAGCLRSLKDEAFDFGAEVRRQAAGSPEWTTPPRRLPQLVLQSSAALDDPRNPVELRPIGPAHTFGDMLVELPQAGILYAGALIFVDRNPYSLDGDVAGWLGNLNAVAKTSPQTVVPLRGEPIDATQVRRLRDALAWVRGQVGASFIDRVPPEEIAPAVMADPGAAKHFDLEIRPSFVEALVQQAVREAVERRKRRGYD